MNRVVIGAVLLVAAVAILLLMWWAWRSRRRRDEDLSVEHAWPAEPGELIGSFDVAYVATTRANERLERLAVDGLTYPGSARLDLRAAGLGLAVRGERPVVLPATSLRRVDLATWTIDRAVETDGLVRVTWSAGATMADTYVRILDPTERDAVLSGIERIITPTPWTKEREES